MSTTLDGKALFDERDLQISIGPWRRATVERAIPNLNGLVSIDLGRRGRSIGQRGTLRAASRTALRSRVTAIESLADGNTHTLVTDDGQEYANVRMDAFEPSEVDANGAGIAIEYEIAYTQLGS